jgi:hypothetical protein
MSPPGLIARDRSNKRLPGCCVANLSSSSSEI